MNSITKYLNMMPEEGITRVGYEFETDWTLGANFIRTEKCVPYYKLYEDEGSIAKCYADSGNGWVEVLSGEYDDFFVYNTLRATKFVGDDLQRCLEPDNCIMTAMEFVTRGDGIFPFAQRSDSLLHTASCLHLFFQAFKNGLNVISSLSGYVVIAESEQYGNFQVPHQIRMNEEIFNFLHDNSAAFKGTENIQDFTRMHVTHSLPVKSFCELTPEDKGFLLNEKGPLEDMTTPRDLLWYYSPADTKGIGTKARGTLPTNMKSPLDIVNPLFHERERVDKWDIKMWCEKKATAMFSKLTMTSTEDTSHMWVTSEHLSSRPKSLFVADWFEFIDSIKIEEAQREQLLPGVGENPTVIHRSEDGHFALVGNPTKDLSSLCSHPLTVNFDAHALFHLSSDENLQPVFKVVGGNKILDFRVLIEHRSKGDKFVKIYSEGLGASYSKVKKIAQTVVPKIQSHYLEIFQALDGYAYALEEDIDDRTEDSDSAGIYGKDDLVESALQPE